METHTLDFANPMIFGWNHVPILGILLLLALAISPPPCNYEGLLLFQDPKTAYHNV